MAMFIRENDDNQVFLDVLCLMYFDVLGYPVLIPYTDLGVLPPPGLRGLNVTVRRENAQKTASIAE